ncbi:MAG: thiosulfate oxidation carrier complex protein SoxZ [Gammaproteobacteria bacterium]|nr:thiosulfate oxidation carrier complex protein SoxZ [Gammaproteobacteria bacterium]
MSLSARVRIPTEARAGEVVEIRTLVSHPMETGFRVDSFGRRVPRNILTRFSCRYADREIVSMDLRPGIAANPYLAFRFVADVSGAIELRWEGQDGEVLVERGHLEVSAA